MGLKSSNLSHHSMGPRDSPPRQCGQTDGNMAGNQQEEEQNQDVQDATAQEDINHEDEQPTISDQTVNPSQQKQEASTSTPQPPTQEYPGTSATEEEEDNWNERPAGSTTGSSIYLTPQRSPSPTKSDFTDAKEHQEGGPDCVIDTATTATSEREHTLPAASGLPQIEIQPPTPIAKTSPTSKQEKEGSGPESPTDEVGSGVFFPEGAQEEHQEPDNIDDETELQTEQQQASPSVAATAPPQELSIEPQPPLVQAYEYPDTDTDSEDGSEGGLALEQTDIDIDIDIADSEHAQVEEEPPLPSDPAPAPTPALAPALALVQIDREAQIGIRPNPSPAPDSDSPSDNGSHMDSESDSPRDEAVGGVSLSEPEHHSTAAQQQDRLLSLPLPPPPSSPPLSLPVSPPVNATATATATASDYIYGPSDPANSENISSPSRPSDLRAGPQQELPPAQESPAATSPRASAIPIRLRSAVQVETEQPDNMSSNTGRNGNTPAHGARNGTGMASSTASPQGSIPAHTGSGPAQTTPTMNAGLSEEEIRRIMMADDDFDPVPAEYRQGAGDQFTSATQPANIAAQQPSTTTQAMQPYSGGGAHEMAYTQAQASNVGFGYPPYIYDHFAPAMPYAPYNMPLGADPRLAYPPPTGPRGRSTSPYATPTIAAGQLVPYGTPPAYNGHAHMSPASANARAGHGSAGGSSPFNQPGQIAGSRGVFIPAQGATFSPGGRQSANQRGHGSAPGVRPGGISGQGQDGQQGDSGDVEDTGGLSLSGEGNGDGEMRPKWN